MKFCSLPPLQPADTWKYIQKRYEMISGFVLLKPVLEFSFPFLKKKWNITVGYVVNSYLLKQIYKFVGQVIMGCQHHSNDVSSHSPPWKLKARWSVCKYVTCAGPKSPVQVKLSELLQLLLLEWFSLCSNNKIQREFKSRWLHATKPERQNIGLILRPTPNSSSPLCGGGVGGALFSRFPPLLALFTTLNESVISPRLVVMVTDL